MNFNTLKKRIKKLFLKIIKKILKLLHSIISKNLINEYLTKIEYIEFFMERKDYKTSFISFHSDTEWILEKLNKDGYCKIKNFWSEDECINGMKSIDDLIRDFPEYVRSENKSDQRVYGAEKISRNINDFSKNKLLISVAKNYNRKETKLGFTLAAKMPAKKHNKGSGEGWHRDAFFRQFKTLLYLSDVSKDNGPFELILNSQNYQNLIEDMREANLGHKQFRLTESQINKILINEPQRKKTILGKMGTLILVDTSTLHRGSPIKNGIRYALTNYYYTLNQIDDALYKKFNVIPFVKIK